MVLVDRVICINGGGGGINRCDENVGLGQKGC